MAGELTRVCRPAGAIGMCNWAPDGLNGQLFEIVTKHIGAPEEPPSEWGKEEHVRGMLGDVVKSFQFERRAVTIKDESAGAYMDFMEESFGPFISARSTLGERWPELRGELLAVFEASNRSGEGFEIDQHYLLAVARL